jgi:hypothetical protein
MVLVFRQYFNFETPGRLVEGVDAWETNEEFMVAPRTTAPAATLNTSRLGIRPDSRLGPSVVLGFNEESS